MSGVVNIGVVILALFLAVAAGVFKINDLQKQTIRNLERVELIASPSATLSPPSPTASPTATPKPTVPVTPKPTAVPKPTTQPVPANNTPPGSGYSRQSVQSEKGTFTVALIAADLGSTKVVVDTASSSDCSNDCPVMSLSEYISRNGAYAGVNGSYFCPADYASCADKKNSFDTLLMNKDKTYFNSDNNVYSTVPAVIFGYGTIRFVGQSLEWGRDTGADSVIANYPMLTQGGNIAYAGSGDGKLTSKGSRSFVGATGGKVYIGVVFSATVEEAAYVMKALGIENALNLDDGGSTALWSGGYKVGPGRGLPNAILFVQR